MFITKHTICFLWTLPNSVQSLFSGALPAGGAAAVAFTGLQIPLSSSISSFQAKCDQDIPLIQQMFQSKRPLLSAT